MNVEIDSGIEVRLREEALRQRRSLRACVEIALERWLPPHAPDQFDNLCPCMGCDEVRQQMDAQHDLVVKHREG